MYGIGPMPHAGCGTQANAMAGGMPVGMRPNAPYGGAHAFPSTIPAAAAGMYGLPTDELRSMAPLPTAERFIKAHSGGVLLDKAGSPAGPIPEGSFVDAKEGKLHGADGKPIAVPQGGSFSLFDMPDVATLVSAYKSTEALHAAVAQNKGTMPGAMPVHDHPMTAVDGQWGPGGVTPIKGGAKGAMPGCGDHGATSVGGAHGGMMPPGKVYGGGGVPALAAQVQQALMQAQQLAASTFGSMPSPGMVAGVNGGGALDAMSATGQLGGMPGLQQSLDELVSTLRQLTAALQKGDAAAPSKAPAKVDDTKPATETSAPAATTTPTSATDDSTSTSTATST